MVNAVASSSVESGMMTNVPYEVVETAVWKKVGNGRRDRMSLIWIGRRRTWLDYWTGVERQWWFSDVLE